MDIHKKTRDALLKLHGMMVQDLKCNDGVTAGYLADNKKLQDILIEYNGIVEVDANLSERIEGLEELIDCI